MAVRALRSFAEGPALILLYSVKAAMAAKPESAIAVFISQAPQRLGLRASVQVSVTRPSAADWSYLAMDKGTKGRTSR